MEYPDSIPNASSILEVNSDNIEAMNSHPVEERLSERKARGDADESPIPSSGEGSLSRVVIAHRNTIKREGHRWPNDPNRTEKIKGDERPGNPDKIEMIKDEVAQTMELMRNNINALIERGEKLESLTDKIDELVEQAGSFRRAAKVVAQKAWWENRKMWIFIILGAVALIVIVCLMAFLVKYL